MEVELKVKPQEAAGKKRVAHEAKHSEVNVKLNICKRRINVRFYGNILRIIIQQMHQAS